MHRTTTAATLLVTVAVSALTGCVEIHRPPAAGSPAAHTRPAEPRPDGSARPRDAQAPAQEALEHVGPRRPPEETARDRPTAAAEEAEDRRRPSSAHSPARQRPRPAPRPPRRVRPPRAGVPAAPPAAPKNLDVCALGREFGHWPADSPQARICRQAYGR
ncbi:hypothetical protein ABZ920_20750 [Streptomyces sp. NPDC046831]|uniref:hypothetical protein n=1 Tax=Streptomyces sp. NPDC046831 TaxID=3154805 RepID=UPI0033E1BD62